MRRRPATALILALALASASCAGGPTGPSAPLAIEQVLPAASLDVAAVRATALAFVRAYADTGADRGLALSRLVAGPDLAEWVRWLGIQTVEFEGVIRGHPDITDVTFAQVASTDEYDLARVRVRASVTFEYEPVDDDPFEITRVLDGPMLLLRVGVADWRVVDLTRDGRTISDGIRDLGDERFRDDGGDLVLVAHSAFLFPVGWQFNVTVENRTSERIELRSAVLETDIGEEDGVATPALTSIPTATGAIGILAFPVGTDLSGATLVLRYRTSDGGIVTLRADLAELVGDAPATTSPAPTEAA
ncbi:MAG: hypothetical protein ACKO8G_03135 [Actinomycetota bacterium]